MAKVKIYNVKKFVAEHVGEPWECYRDNELAVIINGNRAIVTGDEAVHAMFDLSTSEKMKVYLEKKKENSFSMFPESSVDLPVQEFVDKSEYREDELTNFVRRFGSRIEGNYRILLRSIKEIGLDPDNYPREPEEVTV